jgi:hypothetical protein
MRNLRFAGAVLTAASLLTLATGPTYAEATHPTPPRPPIEVPPPREQPQCQYIFGYHLQENGPPIPFLSCGASKALQGAYCEDEPSGLQDDFPVHVTAFELSECVLHPVERVRAGNRNL